MYLKTLTLKGFKSFADTTSLELERGVTVVVGPNGSGKSNVVDAIGWVLGAQAPSALRSSKMDDVIFAGTDKRAALGRAEVALTIDNSDGLVPIEFNEVTITRTLFRTGESEYSINKTPCRLLDVQELLSDAGVGRQQHVIISQGQIDAVLNARPEERRLIIEEAAGVLKYRKRKERSERRLAATETNLTRLGDLLREVRRQLRPLERQAEAARRHGSVVSELNELRVYVAGRELEALNAKLSATERTRLDFGERDRAAKSLLAELDARVIFAESRLSALGGDDLGDDLAQFESLHQQARGLSSLLAERRRGIDRDRNAFVDQGVIFTLEADAADLAGQLVLVEAEAATLEPQGAKLAEAEAALIDERQLFEKHWAEGVVAPSGHAAEVRGEMAALRGSVESGQSETSRVAARLAMINDRTIRFTEQAERLRSELVAAEHSERPLIEALDTADNEYRDAEAALQSASDAFRSRESDFHSWAARADALALALDEARSKAGAQRLAGIDEVLGTLLDLVEVDSGWEAAFEAAAADALTAVVIDGLAPSRSALRALVGDSITGAVLALQTERFPSPAPSIGEPIRRHVRSGRAEVQTLLDALIGHVVVIEGDWADALDAATAHPGAVIVTSAGDRFGPSGWRVGVRGGGATGAALAEARDRAEASDAQRLLAQGVVGDATAALELAGLRKAAIARQLDENDGALAAAADGLQRVETEKRDASTEAEALQSHVDELSRRVARENERLAELELALPALEAEEHNNAALGRSMGEARAHLEERAATVGAMRTDVEVRTTQVGERRQFLERRKSEVEQKLARMAEQRGAVESRRLELDLRQRATDHLMVYVSDRSTTIQGCLNELRERRRQQSEAAREVARELDAMRKERAEAERSLFELRERQGRLEIEAAETKLRIEAAVESLRRDLDIEPEVAIAAECPDLVDGVNPKARIRDLERELRIMGPINPLALQEFEDLSQRHDFLDQQLVDVKESRRELHKIIRAIDDEIVNVFASAFADVSQNFVELFATLFPGGAGALRLTDPDNLLDTGIEIEAKPSGKNVKKLSLLSGGERSLTALAYLFAVFRSRPSPFYVMDEVEAALDDVNLHRFLGLVNEFRAEAQLIIVSHQKRTMEAADCLYGVTMQSGGSSRVVSEKVGAGN